MVAVALAEELVQWMDAGVGDGVGRGQVRVMLVEGAGDMLTMEKGLHVGTLLRSSERFVGVMVVFSENICYRVQQRMFLFSQFDGHTPQMERVLLEDI